MDNKDDWTTTADAEMVESAVRALERAGYRWRSLDGKHYDWYQVVDRMEIFRWIVLDDKGKPIVMFPDEEKAVEFEARGYTVFPTYKVIED